MPDYVYNVDGTSTRKCKCSIGGKTWLAHWERGAKKPLPVKCYASGCPTPVQVGAHVKLVGYDKRVVWIIPFCQYHNKRASDFHIPLKQDYMLVGAAKIDCE